jgi:hypothetical protein
MPGRLPRDRDRPGIYYLVPDYDRPSWGTALLYEHVRLLRTLGYDARVLHRRAPFRLDWFESEVPIDYLDRLEVEPSEDDLLVVPEVLAADGARLPWPCRRGVFVQGSFLVVSGLGGAADYPELGYSFALAVLPHVAQVVERHFGLPADLVPPFVAPYFFRSPEEIRESSRGRLLLLSAKPEYRRAGFPDYEVFTHLIGRRIGANPGGAGWRLVELEGVSHRRAAELMAEASFLVNLNSHEAFNTTVPEAMAAGCLPICYEAVGGRDFLSDGADAFVFPNHHVYPLVEKTLELMAAADRRDPELVRVRLAARATAGRFTEAATREALETVVSRLAGTGARP